jgi:hypothetical protein
MNLRPFLDAPFDQRLLEPVRQWAVLRRPQFRPNGLGRQYGLLNLFDDVPPQAWDLKRALVERLALQHAPQEPVFKDFCGLITEGGAVQRHMDTNSAGLFHVRFNVMVSKPLAGGEPVVDGEVLDIEEGEIFRVDAGLKPHWCLPVRGSKPRIILSFGFLCPRSFIHP